MHTRTIFVQIGEEMSIIERQTKAMNTGTVTEVFRGTSRSISANIYESYAKTLNTIDI